MFVNEIYKDSTLVNPPVDKSWKTLSSVCQALKELASYFLIIPFMLFDKFVTKIRGDDSATAQKVTEIAEDGFALMEDDGIEVQDSNRENAVANLKSDKMLKNNTVVQYLEHLGVEYKDHFISSNPKMYDDFTNSLPEKPTESIYIPVVLKGAIRNHIVLITINPDSTVEYYDSKGDSCEGNKKLLNFPGKTVENLIEDISSKYAANSKQNTKKQQKDLHSCGVFVLNYIQQRENGRSFEEIVEDTVDPLTVRQELFSLTGKAPVDRTPICEKTKNDYLKPLGLKDLPELKVSYCEEFIAPLHKEKITLSSLLQDGEKVYVPIVLRRFEGNRLVLLTFDPKTKTAEYYDPKGEAIGETVKIVTDNEYEVKRSKFVPGSTVFEVIKMQHGLDI